MRKLSATVALCGTKLFRPLSVRSSIVGDHDGSDDSLIWVMQHLHIHSFPRYCR
jgi:hypothetical protein